MTYRFIVELPAKNGLPRDSAINVWHATGLEANIYTYATAIKDFYAKALPSTSKVCSYLSPSRTGDLSMKVFDLSDPLPRVPVGDYEWLAEWTPTGSDSLPTEVAICLSMTGASESGINMATRRGRVFIGPLATNAMTTDSTTKFAKVGPGPIEVLTQAASRLVNEILDADGHLVVYSRKLGTATNVVGGWVDNAPDTQRRRGQDPTARTLWDFGTLP